ncbi:MAG: aldolase/citrate lyase family protein [Bacteroidales bacterium]|nr:aldolase/citrate lyase family protein [Bacteroidales bacterium]NCU36719.1 citrate lyase ACP [Candidatus Falkowbacteria bacterium]MDD2632558.1 aldolase/citrate lyase family protein [Bacteroidales bacterium]MDD3130764.1 aldolase/citrate lyase family protein [Bacteroidales bacterium]MDD4175841.1 aldolase/citrate lyase family protein [Bacteroidales bacterium]
MENTATAGNKGKRVRSDCHVTIRLTNAGGIDIELTSKVKFMFGADIMRRIHEVLDFFEIENAHVVMEDSGALPFVMAARLEAAVKKLVTSEKSFLTEYLEANRYETTKDRNRFSRLYLPGNTPSLMINAGLHHPDGLILDLEDAVAFDKKHEARFLVRNALRSLNLYGAEKMVRINQIPAGLEDLDFIVPHGVNLILVPKCESAEQITAVNRRIAELQKLHNLNAPVWLMPIIESALGVIKAYEIASSAENIVAMAIGLEDYTADLGVRRTNEATESFFARSMVVNACKAARIQAIDSVFSDIADMEALRQNVLTSKSLGFDGMGCIHPRQIRVIHENFAPDKAEIDRAKKIVNAFMDATEKGLGVVSLGTKMIDAPVVKRAQKVINLAISLQLISADWRNEFLAPAAE